MVNISTVIAEEPKEAFIWLRISKTRGNNFYRVLTDEKENPYLNLQEVLTSYLDFSKYKCDMQRKFCEATLPSKDNLTIWIDFQEKQCGSFHSKLTSTLLESDYLIAENVFWVKYDFLEKCFPVEVRWDLSLFYLSIIPSYPLIEDLKTARERSRNYNLAEQKRKQKMSTFVPILPKDNWNSPNFSDTFLSEFC